MALAFTSLGCDNEGITVVGMNVRFLFNSILPAVFLLLFTAETVFAGFGVTPPFVRNDSLTRNSIYEQTITLVRSDPNTPLQASVIVDAPEIANWIEITNGDEFVLPRGEQKVPMTVRITVPDDAEFKRYSGALRIKTGSIADGEGRGAVNISLGAQIDFDLNVIDKVIEDFRIRKVTTPDLNEGHEFAWLFFPGKVNFKMLTENTGNVDIAPSKVKFSIYDYSGVVLLEETENIGRMRKIAPYATEEITASIPTKLPAGNYLVRYEIYNGDEVKQAGETSINILPYGTLQRAGFGFIGLSLSHKISILLPVFALLILVISVIYILRQRKYVQ